MKNYLYCWIAAIILVLCGAVWLLNVLLRQERAERLRYQNNTEALLVENRAYQTKDGQWAMTVQALELSKQELERFRADDARLIASLGVKIKRLESLANTMLETDIEAAAPIVDRPADPERPDSLPLRAFEWADAWTRIDGVLAADSVHIHYRGVDSLLQFVERVPRRFWFIRWGTKAITQTVVSANPHTKVVYNEYIELK